MEWDKNVQEEIDREANMEEEAEKLKMARWQGNSQGEQKGHARGATQEGSGRRAVLCFRSQKEGRTAGREENATDVAHWGMISKIVLDR